MASPATTTAFQPSTAASANLSASSISTSTNSDEVNLKPSYSSKAANGKARQLENTAAAPTGQRQSAAPKAWGPGVSPLGTRTSASNQRNGTTSHTQNVTQPANPPLLREGLKVKVTLDSGAEYEGTYSSGNESSYILKMVQQKKLANTGEMSNGNTKLGREQPSMTFPKATVADIHVTGTALPSRSIRPQNGNSAVFRTDAAISGSRFQGERALKPWVADENIETDLSLESNRNRTSAGPVWDQFEANKRLFGVTTDYDENIYTTAIDKSHPDYQKRYAEADKKAREIENSVATNSHIAEERILDNLKVDDGGLDEEDKYSGVQRQDFPPLAPSNRSNKYTPPARRPTAPQAALAGPLTDPAIISSSLARKESPAGENVKSNITQTSDMSETTLPERKLPQQVAEVKPAVTPEAKGQVADTSASASRTASPQVRSGATLNATATVERDVVSAFKGFAAQQRVQADKLRSSKAKADKEVKLTELKRFAASFKLSSPVPSDLVSIIAKDPVKQREIQEKAKRDAEEQAEKARQAKLNTTTASTSSSSPNTDLKTAQRPPLPPPQAGVTTSGSSSRQSAGRTPPYPPQGPYNSQSFRGDRPNQNQPVPTQNGRPIQGLGARLRSLEQSKSAQLSPPILPHEGRQPPTGPANSADPSFSRRSSGAISMIGNKMNPNSTEFRPNPSAATFNPNGNPSRGSSPRSNSTSAPNQLVLVHSSTLVRRKPLQSTMKSLASNPAETHNDVIESIAAIKVPPSLGKRWEANGDMKPPFDTPPTWRQLLDNEPVESSMYQTYAKLFENPPYPNQAMSPPQPSHVNPQVAHQHQLPFHLQQGPHNMSQRQSPRQPQMHLHNNQHPHGPNVMFNPPDEHRMMPSHSAQSFASPRLQAVGMAYPSPMGQPAQLATYNQPLMQYPMGPSAPQMSQYRSYSGSHQFIPQQATHMAGPVMIPAPAGTGFMGPAGMVSPAPQMIYPGGQPHFIPQGNVPPPMPGSNGYPSPGRSAPMMMTQGSQPGQSAYSMSPGMPYGQPMYTQQQPGQMSNMRNYAAHNQPYGTSPQMHQYGPQSRGAPSGSYKQNYMPQHGPHQPAAQNQIPTGPQSRPLDGGDDTK